MTDRACADFRTASAELALGVLPADERGRAIAHLDGCRDCRDYLQRSTQVGDGLLTLFPANEPPIGFEQRVAARIGVRARREHRPSSARFGDRRWLRFGLAAAAVAVVFGLGGLLGGLLLGRTQPAGGGGAAAAPPAASSTADPPGSGRSTAAGALVDAPLLVGGRQVGEVYAYGGSPAWVYMGVDLGRGGETVSCQLVRRDGGTVTAGSFGLAGGRGYWGAPSPVSPAMLAGARIVAADGAVLATADFDGGR